MKGKAIALFATAILVFASSMVIAHHMETPPPVSSGGELAYVRDYPEQGEFQEDGGWRLEGLYTSFVLHEADDRVSNFTSHGRFGNNVVFEEIDLPSGVLGGERKFHVVQNHQRGILEASDGAGKLLALNGVNAGLSLQSRTDGFEATLVTGEDYDIVNVTEGHVRIQNDGHSYNVAVATDEGNLSVDGNNITVSLDDGGEVRGWLSAFPATQEVMEWEFEHHRMDG